MRRQHFLHAILVALLVAPTTTLSADAESPEQWYQQGRQELAAILASQPNTGRAKNIILFIGDGMGVSTVTAGRIFDGQSRGEPGEENLLSFERFPYVALSKTYNTNQQTPDSAGTMTAMITGVKSKAGFISVDQRAERANCESAQDRDLTTLLEQAENAGLATGIVTTARITHATPAATYAHVPERDWEDDADIPETEKAAGCQDIASQLVDFSYGDGIEVALGGGRRSFLSKNQTDPDGRNNGGRADGRHLIAEWEQRYPDGKFVWNKSGFDAVDVDNTSHLLGLFNRSHMQYEQDRINDGNTEPSLAAMTRTAIKLLQKNPNGFFLMVEGGRIDHAHHANNAQRALKDTQAFAWAVESALELVDTDETLIIVTADHSHTFTLAGYPTRGNPILGKVVGNDAAGNPETTAEQAADKLPYTTVGYRNGRGFAEDAGGDRRYARPYDTGRKDLSNVDTRDPDFHQAALVPLDTETHGGEDVAIYATGPWAHLFQRTHEQHYIYHVMRHALQLETRNQP